MSDVAVLLILSVNRFAKVPAFSTVKLYSDCSPSSFKAISFQIPIEKLERLHLGIKISELFQYDKSAPPPL